MIDHIVLSTPNFHQTLQQIQAQFGIPPTYGGKHQNHGTHNALLNLGKGCYLEILAVDPENQKIQSPRWMAVDLVKTATLSRWALKTNDLSQDTKVLKTVNARLSKTQTGSRQRTDGSSLHWEMSIPLPEPEVEVMPFLLDWKDSPHPTESLPQHCELLNFYVEHPEPEKIKTIFEKLKTQVKVEQGSHPKLIAEIMTPNGKIILL